MTVAHLRHVRVIHVYRTYFPDPEGGLQEAIRQICKAVRPFGIDSTVFCLSPQPRPQRLESDGFVTWRSRSFAAPASCDLGGPDAWRLFCRLSADHDVVHYHFPWPFADLLHLTVRPKARAVMTYHSDIVRQAIIARLYTPLMWRMMESMETIIATSPNYAATSLLLNDARVKNKIQTIPLGMEDIRLRNYLPIVSEGKPFFLFIGVLRYYKGLSTLIKASKQVKAKIIIAGEGPEGPSLRRMAKEMDCDNVEFVGRIDEMEKFRLLASCRAFVMPSHQRSEAFGMALVEGAIFSRPLVSCEIGTGTSFVNVDGKTGFVVAPNDPDALASALNRLLENEELAHHLGRAARSRYEILFSAEAFGKCYAQLYSMGTQSLNR